MTTRGASVVRVRVKACCISTVPELNDAVSLGASIVGFITDMQTMGAIPDQKIEALLNASPDNIETLLLLREQTAETIAAHYSSLPAKGIQLVRTVQKAELLELRRILPATKLVQVIYVGDESAIDEAVDIAPYVDAVHLDSAHGHPTLPQLGGTGHTHDWSISRRIRDQVQVPVILAGGLNETNVRAAIETVRPWAVDVCHGVRDENDELDRERLRAFIGAAQSVGTERPPNQGGWAVG